LGALDLLRQHENHAIEWSMSALASENFGVVIAYIIPGTAVLYSFRGDSGLVDLWFAGNPVTSPTVAGFLFVSLAAVAVGLVLSTIRWLVLDTLHHHTGMPPPQRDFRILADRVEAFQTLVENRYRYYQFYGNSLVALLVILPGQLWANRLNWSQIFGLAILGLILFLGSRSSLAGYYKESAQLLGSASSPQD